MRSEKTVQIKIDEKTTRAFTVFEVRVRDLKNLLDASDMDKSMLELVEKNLHLFTDAGLDDLEALYPSDLEKLYLAWREVNAPLLRAAKALDLGPLLETLRSSLLNDLMSFAHSLSPQDTPTSLTTDGDFSFPASTSTTKPV
jgi:hypothetical protein